MGGVFFFLLFPALVNGAELGRAKQSKAKQSKAILVKVSWSLACFPGLKSSAIGRSSTRVRVGGIASIFFSLGC